MTKKLLLVGTNSIHTFNYLRLIEGYFDDIFVITDADSPEIRNYKHCIVNFSIKNPFIAIQSIQKIKKSIASFSPTIIHVHQVGTTALFSILANKKNQPLVLTAWGSDVLHTPYKNSLYYQLARYCLKKADYITADAAFMGEKIREITKDENINICIANFGVEIEEAENIEKENIIYSNRLHKNFYRIDKIITAFSHFVQKKKDWKLLIAGSGEETENLKKQVTELGIEKNVQFMGWLDKDQNRKIYQKSKFFVSVPISDGTAISLLEAMGYGCIPIVINLPSNLEWVKNEKNGVVVNDIDSHFFDNIFKVDFNKASSLNKKIIREKGTKEVNRQLFLEIYHKLMK
jgi:glycosyltransferase involved in cell wall biosynthesis